LVKLNEPEMEKILQSGEAELKKLKVEHRVEFHKVRRHVTEAAYREAWKLYRMERPEHAKEVLGDIQNLIPYYKSSDTFLKYLERHPPPEKVPGPEPDPQLAIHFKQQASMLTFQAQDLNGNATTDPLPAKIARLKTSMEQMYQDVYVQKEMKRISAQATAYDEEVFQLTEQKKYREAKAKLGEFEQKMYKELIRVKALIDQRKTTHFTLDELKRRHIITDSSPIY